MEIQQNISLKALNTFGVDVKAKYFAKAQSEEDLKQALDYAKTNNLPLLPLGGGSNILFTQDVAGLVIQNSIGGVKAVREDDDTVWVKVGGGVVWHDFVLHCVSQNWGGVENLSLIPGSVGASPIQNIGAYGVEIKDVFEELEAIEIATAQKQTFKHQDCRFGYRNSVFKQELKGKFIITSVTFRLTKRNHRLNTSYGIISKVLEEQGITAPNISQISEAVISIRESKLPNPAEVGNCGSFFKNPEIPISQFEVLKGKFPNVVSYPASEEGKIKVPAGWLIEQCGWKGKQVGNVGTYPKQALVLINCGNATGEEAKSLAYQIQASVKEKFGVLIEPEVNIV